MAIIRRPIERMHDSVTNFDWAIILVYLAGVVGIGIAAVGAELAIGRNPGTFGKVFTVMLIGMALAEGLAILAIFLVSRTGN